MMKRLTLVLFVSSAIFFSSCQSSDDYVENALCITNVSTIDAIHGLQENQTVIIQDERIIKVANSDELSLSPNHQVIDGTGQFLIPGLWDAHVHFAFNEAMAPAMFSLFLGYGITSVRDTGGEFEFVNQWKQQSLANPTEAPRVKIAGPLIDGEPNVYDGSAPFFPPLSVGNGTVEEAVKLVDQLIDQGVDLIKAYEMLTPDQFRAIITRAHEAGLKVTGHVPLSMDVISASEAGMNSMEHLRNVELSTAADPEELLAQRTIMLEKGSETAGSQLRSSIHSAQRYEAVQDQDLENVEAVVEVLAQNDTWQIPTLTLYSGRVTKPYMDEDWQQSIAYLPDSLANRWNTGIEQIMDAETPQNGVNYMNWMYEMVERMHKKGINFMAGTDCPIFYLTPGFSLHEELENMVKAGFSPMEALRAATLNPALYFDMQKELGLIEENMIADLVLLSANPLEDITHTRRIAAVVKHGKLYNRADLDQLLESIAKYVP